MSNTYSRSENAAIVTSDRINGTRKRVGIHTTRLM